MFDELDLGPEPESHYSRLDGWLYEMFEEIPDVDDFYIYRQVILSYEHDEEIDRVLILRFTVKDIKERRISYVHLTVEEEEDDDE